MAAFILFALLALIGVASAVVLADSGLRWWSAFGGLRRQSQGETAPLGAAGMRPAIVHGGYSGFGRSTGARAFTRSAVLRAAA